MKSFLKVVGWIFAGLAGLFIWYAFPDIQPIVTWGLAAGFSYKVVSSVVEEAMRKVLGTEIAELRRQNYEMSQKLADVQRYARDTWNQVSERNRGRY